MPALRSILPFVIALLPAAGVQAAGPAPGLEASIRTLTLAEADRQQDGLVRDGALTAIARAHSRAMYDAGTLAHELGGLGPADRFAREHRTLFGLVSENVAMQKHWPPASDLASRLVTAWMNSPGHRTNILADYRIFEVGCHGDRQVMYCTQLFVREPTRLARPVAFLQTTGADVIVTLADPPRDARSRRVSLGPAGNSPSGDGVPVTAGAATLPVPATPGLHQLELWTADEPGSNRYRIIAGPYVCVLPPMPAQPSRQAWPRRCRP